MNGPDIMPGAENENPLRKGKHVLKKESKKCSMRVEEHMDRIGLPQSFVKKANALGARDVPNT